MMRTRRRWVIWSTAAVAALALFCWRWLYPGSSCPGGCIFVNASSTEALAIFDGKATEFRGPARLNLPQAVSDGAYLKTRWSLFLGRKLVPLVTADAKLQELASAFPVYADGRGAMVPGEPEEWCTARFGKYDSGAFQGRRKAADAIVKLLDNAGWRVAKLTDGKVLFLSPTNYELLLAAKSRARQEVLWQQFEGAGPVSEKEGSAQRLSRLWRVGFLDDQVKGQLVEKHYRLELRQLPSGGWPSWEVRSQRTFPFPNIQTDFTPTLYRNGLPKWSPGRPQLTCAMNASGIPITSMSGGEFQNGDVLQCKIELSQKVDGRTWRWTLWSDKIVLQGLKL